MFRTRRIIGASDTVKTVHPSHHMFINGFHERVNVYTVRYFMENDPGFPAPHLFHRIRPRMGDSARTRLIVFTDTLNIRHHTTRREIRARHNR